MRVRAYETLTKRHKGKTGGNPRVTTVRILSLFATFQEEPARGRARPPGVGIVGAGDASSGPAEPSPAAVSADIRKIAYPTLTIVKVWACSGFADFRATAAGDDSEGPLEASPAPTMPTPARPPLRGPAPPGRWQKATESGTVGYPSGYLRFCTLLVCVSYAFRMRARAYETHTKRTRSRVEPQPMPQL
jgi:hypothetical protein